jgi:hypothetical protein
MELAVEIKGNNVFPIATDLFSSTTLKRGDTKSITDDITIRYEITSQPLIASIDNQAFLQIALVFVKDVLLPTGVTVLSNYLYDKLKERNVKSIKICDTYITHINVQQIYQTIINESCQEKDKTDNSTKR